MDLYIRYHCTVTVKTFSKGRKKRLGIQKKINEWAAITCIVIGIALHRQKGLSVTIQITQISLSDWQWLIVLSIFHNISMLERKKSLFQKDGKLCWVFLTVLRLPVVEVFSPCRTDNVNLSVWRNCVELDHDCWVQVVFRLSLDEVIQWKTYWRIVTYCFCIICFCQQILIFCSLLYVKKKKNK